MLLVEEIATCIWRKRRVLRFEMGEIQKRLNSDAYLQPFHKLDEVNRDILILQYQHARGYDAGDKELSTEEWFQARQMQQSSLLTHPVGIQYVRLVLMDTKAEIQKTGSLSSKSFKELMATVGYCDKSLTHACSLLVPAKSDEIKGEACDPRTEDNDEQTKLADRKVAIELLDRKLESLESLLDLALENDRVERNAQVNSLVLPNDRANDKVLRSEAQLDRQRYRAMAELERLQRRREGENVPPPLNVNLGRQR
jgi:hypothetical protein